MNRKGSSNRGNKGSRAGFTLLETTIVVIIIGLLAGIVLFAVRKALVVSRAAGERQLVVSLKMGVEQFKTEFGFLPPLINDDMGPVIGSPLRPLVRNDAFLAYATEPDEARYSVHSLPVYLMGTLDADDGAGKPIDGAPGPQYTGAVADGSFKQRGKVYDPYFDASRDSGRPRLIRTGPDDLAPTFVDRWGTSIRYYRWSPSFYPSSHPTKAGQLWEYHTPRSVGFAVTDSEMRDASFAIVSYGEDKMSDHRKPFSRDPMDPGPATDDAARPGSTPDDTFKLLKDNIVEVGK